jgi:hypothetical protein
MKPYHKVIPRKVLLLDIPYPVLGAEEFVFTAIASPDGVRH